MAEKSTMQELKEWASKNKLKAVFGVWAAGLAGSMAYQWTRPVPTSLKIIHSRVYAQALTLAGLAGAALADYLEHKEGTFQELEYAKGKLHELERRLGFHGGNGGDGGK